MRSIEVSTGVFAAIWSARRNGEESENQILARILGISSSGQQPVEAERPTGRRVTWIDDVVAAMVQLGGRASYAELYEAVRDIRAAAGRSLPPSANAIIRREVENHAFESEAYTGPDLFYAPEGLGAGVWALKEQRTT